MGLGFNTPTAIFIILSIVIMIGTGEWRNGVTLFVVYAICIMLWRFLTR